ncbi:MAG: hypothetical protein NZ889_00795 [Candidatus Pacearchaeota archaeon]|nr:hypothetical protein [Candidatus Pacearchaeota archaeon]
MKRGFFLLMVFVLSIKLASAQQISITNLLSNEWFNAGLLFLIIFVCCLIVLKRIFRASYGVAVIMSLILGIAGSFSIIAKYGLIFQKFDFWAFFLIFLIVLALVMLSSRTKRAGAIIFLFTIGIAWFAYGKEIFCPPKGTLSSNTCTLLNTIMGILILIAFALLLSAIFSRTKWKQAERTEREEEVILVIRVYGTGTTTPAPGTYRFKKGTKVTISAITLDQQHPFSHWTINGRNVRGARQKLKLNKDTDAVAVFGAVQPPPPVKPTKVTLKIEVRPPEGGKTNPSPGVHTYDKGTTVTIRAIPAENFKVAYWLVNGKQENKGKRILNLVLDKDYYVVVIFESKEDAKKSKELFIKLKIKGKTAKGGEHIFIGEVKKGEKIGVEGSWGGGVPPYQVLFYTRVNGKEKWLGDKQIEYKGEKAKRTVSFDAPSGSRVVIGLLVEDSHPSQPRLSQAEIELKVV